MIMVASNIVPPFIMCPVALTIRLIAKMSVYAMFIQDIAQLMQGRFINNRLYHEVAAHQYSHGVVFQR